MIQAIISSIITVAVLVTGFLNMPAEWIGFGDNFGTSVTTISGTDTMSDFPTTYNANLSALNAGKMEISTTTLPLITTLTGLTTTGTIGTGVWEGTPIGVGYNGTGTTSPTQYLTMLGNGALGLTHASSTGTSGQFLTSGGAGAYPSWQSSSVTQSDSFNWTGGHTFTSASTTFLGATMVGIGTSTPYAPLSVVGETVSGYFTATTSTSTFPNILVTNNASTSNLFIGGTQTGGTWAYTGSSTAYSVTSGTTNYADNIPAEANFGMTSAFMNCTQDDYGSATIARSGLTSSQVGNANAGTVANYKFTFSGTTLIVEEEADSSTDCVVSGTMYWYK